MRRALAATVIALAMVGVAPSAAPATKPRIGTLQTASAVSAALNGNIDYTVYLPYGYDQGSQRYPVLYLLHGRGDTMQAWTRIKADLDTLIAKGEVPPVIAVLPDARWSNRGNYYVDSAYTGADPGRPVETALTRDLVAHVDATYRTAAHRRARLVGGYSMGGSGALRYALAHQDLFANALVLSPAVYTPVPPTDSSAREFGAFGKDGALFDEGVYQTLNYPALLSGLNEDLPVRMFIAVGDDEWMSPEPQHDLDFEAAKVYSAVRRADAVAAEFRVLDGGHDWAVWQPAFVAGLKHLSPTLNVTPPAGLPTPLHGTAGSDRAGGVAGHADGTSTLAMAIPGPFGGLDAQVTRLATDGKTPLWTKQFGTPSNDRLYGVVPLSDGGVITAGYTRGNLDGAHPSSPADDMIVARLSATGELVWLRQFGDPAKADRVYGLTAAPDGGVYLAGYTSGTQDGVSAGDKDAILARLTAAGELSWVRQLGAATEDKAFAVAADASGVYVSGSAGADGWIARYSPEGVKQWMNATDGMLAGLAVDSTGRAIATGTDLTVAAYTAAGAQAWSNVLGGGVGADVVVLPSGEIAVIAFGEGIWGVAAGGVDVVVLRFDRRGRQVAAAQFGSARDDGADSFGEENLYATLSGGRILITGLTADTDIFLASVDPATGLP